MIQNNRFLPPSPLPHSLLPRGRRQGRYVPFSANHTNGTTYDFLGQLIAAGYSNTGLTDESYSYDSNGNRITANGSNYTTGSNNELTSDGSWTYTYDDEGNRVSKTNSTHRELYEWDYRNRLTKVTQQEYNSSTEEWQDVQIVEYTYDYNNIWIRKLLDTNGDGTPDSKSIFIPENYQTTVQIDDGIVTHHYLWTPNQQDKLLADTTTDGVLWSLTDHLGSIRDIIQQTSFGLVVPAHLIYDVFGNIISCTDSTGQAIENPVLFAYTGKAFDVDTHLQNNINRWYDADVGRWLSNDPIGFDGNDTNLYRYIQNHPSIFCDPSGLELQQAGCCNSQRIETILDITNQILLAPKCQKWFRNHGFNGPIGTSPNWTVNCHSNWKVMCLLGFPAWTMPGLGIGLCESQLDSYGDIAWASLLIHELAHHFCTSFAGREACAISAQNDCDGT